MLKSRAELDADLYQLHAAMPLWRKVLRSSDEFHAKYQEMSARVLATAAPKDRDWVRSQLTDLLSSATDRDVLAADITEWPPRRTNHRGN